MYDRRDIPTTKYMIIIWRQHDITISIILINSCIMLNYENLSP